MFDKLNCPPVASIDFVFILDGSNKRAISLMFSNFELSAPNNFLVIFLKYNASGVSSKELASTLKPSCRWWQFKRKGLKHIYQLWTKFYFFSKGHVNIQNLSCQPELMMHCMVNLDTRSATSASSTSNASLPTWLTRSFATLLVILVPIQLIAFSIYF